jgi:hypothetical protein
LLEPVINLLLQIITRQVLQHAEEFEVLGTSEILPKNILLRANTHGTMNLINIL